VATSVLPQAAIHAALLVVYSLLDYRNVALLNTAGHTPLGVVRRRSDGLFRVTPPRYPSGMTDDATHNQPTPSGAENAKEAVTGSGEFGKRAEVFPTEPVAVMPVSEIVDSGGPLLGTPIDAAPSTPAASTPSASDAE
jgi:hypothetical protein